MPRKLVQFLALVLTALALVPAGAHLLALPNKIGLVREQYFIVQSIYRGWALLGIVLFGALAANLTLAVLVRRQRMASGLAFASFGCIALTLAIFFIWTFPANQATGNWTEIPANWETLRTHWEYAHAADGGITFAALCCVILSVLAAKAD